MPDEDPTEPTEQAHSTAAPDAGAEETTNHGPSGAGPFSQLEGQPDGDSGQAAGDGAEPFELALRRQDDAVLPDHFEVVDKYWVNAPFAYVLILRDTRREDVQYRVVEPPLTESERTLYHTIRHELKDRLLYRTEPSESVNRERQLETNARKALSELGLEVAPGSFQKLLYYLRRDLINYGRLDPLMNDALLEEISVNGPELPVYIYHRDHEDMKTNIWFDEEDELDSFVVKIAQRSGSDISKSEPMEGTSLPDGSRAQLSLNDEVTPRGSSVTIRKFREEPFSPVELIQYGTFSLEQMAYLWMLISNGYSGIVAGGTGSGKTTTLNACSMFIPPKSKIVSIEDTREVQLPHENWIQSLTREGYASEDNSIEMGDLLEAALRQRPEYMVVGEVRGSEAYTMFQAMNTGHTTYSTMHADSMDSTLSRLENKPMGVERELIGELGFVAIQNVAHVDGQKVRRNNDLIEVIGLDEERKLNYREVFSWNEGTDEITRQANSKHAEQLRNEGKNPEKMMRERYEVLEYLLENDIVAYDPTTTVVSMFNRAPHIVLDMIEDDDLDVERLEQLAEDDIMTAGARPSEAEPDPEGGVAPTAGQAAAEADGGREVFGPDE